MMSNSQFVDPNRAIKETLISTIQTLYAKGDIIELRAFKDRKVSSGYFDETEALTKAALQLDKQGYQVYVTLNPVKPVLLARAQIRVVGRPGSTTSDTDVLFRRWLLLDFDPVRPSGISASVEEKQGAKRQGVEVRNFLREHGWPDPVVADSGNGFIAHNKSTLHPHRCGSFLIA
jgi:hypothetical protein